MGVELVGHGDLVELAVPHHADPVGHRQGLLLVVGDEERGRAQPLLHRLDLLPELQPDLGIERRQRLVEQQDLRLDGQRAGPRNALLLAAGQLVRVLPRVLGEPDDIEQLGGALPPLGSSQAAHPQPEADVLQRGHVREQAVALEHDARAGVGGLKAGQDAQGRGLTAARRPEQGHELARRDFERQPVERSQRAERPGQVRDNDRHADVAVRTGDQWRVGCLGDVRRHRVSPVSWRATDTRSTWPPPMRRALLPPIIVMASRKIQVTNSANSEAATETGPLVWSKLTIHTGKVWYWSRLAIVNSPRTSATVSTVADSNAVRRFGRITRQSVTGQPPPSEFDASTSVLRSSDRSPASSDR